MKLSRFGLLLASLTIVGGALVAACGDDDEGGSTPTPTPTNDAGSTTGDGALPGAGTPDASDSGATDAGDAGSTTPKALGQTCAANAECESAVCFVGGTGGGGGPTDGFCTLECTQPGTDNVAPCNQHADVFSGKCNGQRRCQKK